jgi:hypothetical protein
MLEDNGKDEMAKKVTNEEVLECIWEK